MNQTVSISVSNYHIPNYLKQFISVVFTCTVTVFHKDVTDNQLGTCALHGSSSGITSNSSSAFQPDNESGLDNSTDIESIPVVESE